MKPTSAGWLNEYEPPLPIRIPDILKPEDIQGVHAALAHIWITMHRKKGEE
jgi:hypothetical protein